MTDRPYDMSVTFALNKRGIDDIDHGRVSTENVKVVTIPDEEFWSAYDSGLIDVVNFHYDLILSDYESGIVDHDFDFLLSTLRPLAEKCPIMLSAVEEGCKLGHCIEFSF